MITVEILKYKYPSYNYNTPTVTRGPFPGFPHSPTYVSHNERFKMDKLEYAKYLSTLPVKKGDIVMSKHCKVTGELRNWQCSEVADIIEVHHQVDSWMSVEAGGAQCLVLRNVNGELEAFKGFGTMMVPVPEEKLPHDWRLFLARRKAAENDDPEYVYAG